MWKFTKKNKTLKLQNCLVCEEMTDFSIDCNCIICENVMQNFL